MRANGTARGARSCRRVLMTADGVGGVWPYALDLCSSLSARGVEVTVAVMGPPLLDHQRAEATARGVDVVEGGYRLEWMENPWDDVEAAGEWLLDLERGIRPDVVHLNGFCHAPLPWRAPTVVVGHSCVRSWWRGVHGVDTPPEWNAYSDAVARGLRAANLVAAPSAAMLSELQAHYGFEAPAVVIPNGCADLPAHGVAVQRRRREIVFSAGRIWDPAKNIDALCAIAPAVRWPVFVAGELAQGPNACAHAGYVNYLGRLPRRTLLDWFGEAAIYALPARYEPFGLSVLEAAAGGCALVLGDIRSLRENWSGAALFVPPDNRRALAVAIQRLIDDPHERERLAARARERAGAFTVERMTDGYLQAYSRVLTPAVAA